MKNPISLLKSSPRKLAATAVLLFLLFPLITMIIIAPGNVYAACTIQPQTGTCVAGSTSGSGTGSEIGNGCSNATAACVTNTPLVQDIQKFVDFLSAGVGVVVVAMLIVGGIQYSAAGDNPQAVTSAKKRIINALIALFAYAFTFAFLQWLIPGGLFG